MALAKTGKESNNNRAVIASDYTNNGIRCIFSKGDTYYSKSYVMDWLTKNINAIISQL